MVSVKDFFKKDYQSKILSSTNIQDVANEVESVEYVDSYIDDSLRFIPNIDFSVPANFAFFGSAEKYYSDSITRIRTTYPFDGSAREKIEWHNSSSYLDKYMFDNEYPRTNGFARFSISGWGARVARSTSGYGAPASASMEYIQVKGGPNEGPDGNRVGANIYNVSDKRESNLKFDAATGVTVEFWLKKGVPVVASSEKEVIFDLYNGASITHAAGSTYGRFIIFITGSSSTSVNPFRLTCVSGTVSAATNVSIGTGSATATGLLDDTWNHYAVAVKNSGTSLNIKFYVNGELNNTVSVSNGAIGEVTGSLIANIGALRAKAVPVEAIPSDEGWGKLSGSIDEFRFWKTQRTSKDIGRYWFSQVNGGTNEDTSNTDLGVYFKFNEGITTNLSTDAIVLDYSGRISHGAWTGYAANHRSTGSAIVEASASLSEFKDPIIYSHHPDVVSLVDSKQEIGLGHDITNNALLYHSVPEWIIEQDEEKEAYQVKNLTQIISSFFDESYLKIQELSKLKDINYISGSNVKPIPFASRLLESAGFIAPEIFVDASIISQFAARDEKRLFDKKLHDIKNMIYQNVYNNLTYIYKSKGTEKSIRNLVRCFGVDDELIKLNLYGNNITHTLKENYRSTTVRKKYADFNNVDRFSATVYQQRFDYVTGSESYISGSGASSGLERYNPITVECEVIFPKKFTEQKEAFFETPFLTSSLFGMHTANETGSIAMADFTWESPDYSNFQVFAIRRKLESKDVYFMLTSSVGGAFSAITSSLFRDVYDNTKWNFAVRVKPDKHPLVNKVSGSTSPGTYTVEFYGVQTVLNSVINEFETSSSISLNSGLELLSGNKRLYCGAHRTNFTGSVREKSDTKISSLRYWLDYLSNDTIKAHAYDATNAGREHPYANAMLQQLTLNGVHIPQIATLALDWNFATVTGSNASQQFFVPDVSSGSLGVVTSYYSNPSTSDAIMLYRMNEASAASNAIDETGVFIDLPVFPAGTPSVETGRIDGSRGISQDEYFIHGACSTTLGNPQDFTITSWVYPTGSHGDPFPIFRIRNDSSNGFAFWLGDNNLVPGNPDPEFEINFTDLNGLTLTNPSGALSLNTWHQLVGTYNGTTGEANYYVDGVLVDTDTKTGTLTVSYDASANAVMIGGSPYGVGNLYWPGRIDEVAMYNTVKSADWVLNSYNINNPVSVTSSVSGRYGWARNIVDKHHPGQGDFFPASNTNVIDKEYVLVAKQKLPESIDSSDMIEILDRDDETFTRDARPISYFFAIEKSMYQTISEEMINMFATIKDFNNLIGEPVYRYRQDYKEMQKLRQLFYEKVSNIPDFEKYVEFYKWIDSALSKMIQKLVPASANISDEIRTVIESHILERNKYCSKFPTLEMQTGSYEGGTQGINRHLYSWKSGSAPIGLSQTENPVWWLQRAERNKPPFDNVNDVATSKVMILSASLQVLNRSFTTPLHLSASFLTQASSSIYPIRIENVKTVFTHNNGPWTSELTRGTASYSASIPNYLKDYQIVQTSGRKTNNKTLVISGSLIDFSSLVNSPYIQGLTEYAKMRFARQEHVFVERFSSPGGPETAGDIDGGPGLDRTSAEYSPYNNLNFRNLLLREPLTIWQARACGQFGVDTTLSAIRSLDYNTSASFHKVNRNAAERIEIPASGPILTASVFDNWFIQHPIPQSDTGYRWISSSFLTSPFGHATSSADVRFVTSSDYGSYRTTVGGISRKFGATQMVVSLVGTSDQFQPTDFVGLNYHIYEPITSSVNTLGYSSNVGLSTYYNTKFGTLLAASTPQLFNAIMLHRNGPYENPMWKQLRISEHPVARYNRNNNIISIIDKSDAEVRQTVRGQRIVGRLLHGGRILNYTEPVVTVSYPFIHEVISEDENGKRIVIPMKYSYINNVITFSNIDLVNRLGLGREGKQIYNEIISAYSDNTNDLENPLKQFKSLSYKEKIFPSKENSFINENRNRIHFTNVNRWADTRVDRNISASYAGSQGQTLRGTSIWPLDGRTSYTTMRCVEYRDSEPTLIDDIQCEGELQKSQMTFHTQSGTSGEDFNIRPHAIYNRRIPEYISNPQMPGLLTGSRVFAGDTEWSAATERGKNPAYQHFTDYSNDVFYSGKDYSIIPEFRISEHMNYYIDSKFGNFLADNERFLNITGASISDSGETNFYKTYSHSDFLRYFKMVQEDHKEVGAPTKISLTCKAKMKFLPYKGFYPVERTLQLATLFSQSYGDYVNRAEYSSSFTYSQADKAKWRAFLTPFFAPGILYNSIKSGIAVDFPVYTDQKNPPDILNDFAAGTSSFSDYKEGFWALKSNFSKRLPFEALVEPENYLAKSKIWDMEADPSASARSIHSDKWSNQAALWSGKGSEKYKLAMHNFLAEVPNFFLNQGSLTTLVSKQIPKEGLIITPAQSKKFFGMDIYLSNSELMSLTDWYAKKALPEYNVLGFTANSKHLNLDNLYDVKGIHTQMYSRDSAFGVPWTFDNPLFRSGSNSYLASAPAARATDSQDGLHFGFEPYTPSYQNGFGLVRLHFYPFKGADKYTLDEIQSNLTASYIRMPTERTGSNAFKAIDRLLSWQTMIANDKNMLITGTLNTVVYTHAPYYYASIISSASSNWQQLSSSINFLIKTKVKKNIYETDEDGNFTPTAFEDDSSTDEIWTIQPKWETPILNFKNKSPSLPVDGSGSVAKGMWHQYGDDLSEGEGIYIGVGDIPKSILTTTNNVVSLGTDEQLLARRGISESFVQQEIKNAEIKIYVRDAGVLSANIGFVFSAKGSNYVINGDTGAPATSSWTGYKFVSYTRAPSNYSTCVNIANAINTDSDTSYFLTASAFSVNKNEDNPWNTTVPYYHEITGSSNSKSIYESMSGLISGGVELAGVSIKIKNVRTAAVGYPYYYVSGKQGNEIEMRVSRDYGVGGSPDNKWVDLHESSGTLTLVGNTRDLSVYPADLDYFSATEFCAIESYDANGNRIFADRGKFHGGDDRFFEVESLADLVGFQKTKKRIGVTANEKLIKEAVVAVPFIEKNGQKKFFNIPRYQVDYTLNKIKLRRGQMQPGQSVTEMVKRMKDYVFPPKMDFITNRTVKPYAAYIFEFEHVLSKRDLLDIWQNLMPDIGIKFKEQQTTIQHSLLSNELMNGEIESSLRWMVFKVKQRAEKNYFAKTADTSDDSRFKFNFEIGDKFGAKTSVPDYSYNWPYDFFSLVELVKMDAEIKIEANPEVVKDANPDRGGRIEKADLPGILEPPETIFSNPTLSEQVKMTTNPVQQGVMNQIANIPTTRKRK